MTTTDPEEPTDAPAPPVVAVVVTREAAYRAADALITPELISELYRVPAASSRIFRIPDLRVVKVSFPRPVVQGGLRDRDMHAGQHHVPLATTVLKPRSR